MSLIMQEKVRETHALSLGLRNTLQAIAKYADNEGRGAYASQAKYAESAGITRGRVNRNIKTLIEKGYLVEVGQRASQCKEYNIILPDDSKAKAEKTPPKTTETQQTTHVSFTGFDMCQMLIAHVSVALQHMCRLHTDTCVATDTPPVAETTHESLNESLDLSFNRLNESLELNARAREEAIPVHFQNGLGQSNHQPNQYQAVEDLRGHSLFQAFEEALGAKQAVNSLYAQRDYATACDMVRIGITAEEVKRAVQAKRDAGKTSFRFDWLPEWVNEHRNGQPTRLTRLIPVDEHGNEIDMSKPPVHDGDLIRVDLAADFEELAAAKVVAF